MTSIGCGEWTAYIVGRGGSPTRYELPHESLRGSRVINSSGNASVSVSNSGENWTACCEALNESEPWRDEVLLYRDKEVAYVGPLIGLSSNQDGGSLSSQDLFAWMEQRFIEENFHGDGDVSDIFHSIFDLAYEKDESPNIEISTRQTGTDAIRDFKGTEFHRAADIMRELARTGLDFTMDGRRLLAGTLEDYLSSTAIIIHDEGVLSADVSREGSNFATDVAVFAGAAKAGEEPVFGRAVRSFERYGLIQRSFTELLIKDTPSADANALARLLSMQPAPIRLKVTLSPEAAFEFSDLIPGRRVEVRLNRSAGCVPVIGPMRLQQVDYSVNVGEGGTTEEVSLQLIPLGEDGEVD